MSYYEQLVRQWCELGLVCSYVRMTRPHVAVYPVSAQTWYLRLGTVQQHVLVKYTQGQLTLVHVLPPGKHTPIYVAVPNFNSMLQRCLLVPRMIAYSTYPEDVITWILSGQLCDIVLPTHPATVRRQVYTRLIHAFMHS